MVTVLQFKKAALGLAGSTEEPHFEKTSFRIRKKIFATLDVKAARACIKLNETDQSVFCLDKAVYPVPNKWGKQGWTFIELKTVHKDLCMDALQTAYNTVAGKQRQS
ncbi:MAG: MmcQ/YjbR family DNA-binding protein [Cyclobacteriaceae bacterium]|nr:MmcQ/YjbR family DNA-binding protein [Cyclobacteriaceae bacterium]